MPVPERPKIYHIVHIDRLQSIITDGYLWCDAEVIQRAPPGTTIGMNSIKRRRLRELTLTSYPDLHVGDCVPFYFCPRSIMLYLISRANHAELTYRGGQEAIVHLEADLEDSVSWAQRSGQRWAFTLSNAGAYYFEDRCDLAQLSEIDWDAVQANHWSGNGIPQRFKEGKQAEFLMEFNFPWRLVERVGVYSQRIYQEVKNTLAEADHRPRVSILPGWYY